MYITAVSSKNLRKRFLTACKQSVSARKKYAKDFYFLLLWYSTFVSSRSEPTSEDYAQLRKLQLLELQLNLSKNTIDGLQDTLYSRKANISRIACGENVITPSRNGLKIRKTVCFVTHLHWKHSKPSKNLFFRKMAKPV